MERCKTQRDENRRRMPRTEIRFRERADSLLPQQLGGLESTVSSAAVQLRTKSVTSVVKQYNLAPMLKKEGYRRDVHNAMR